MRIQTVISCYTHVVIHTCNEASILPQIFSSLDLTWPSSVCDGESPSEVTKFLHKHGTLLLPKVILLMRQRYLSAILNLLQNWVYYEHKVCGFIICFLPLHWQYESHSWCPRWSLSHQSFQNILHIPDVLILAFPIIFIWHFFTNYSLSVW